MAHLRAWFICGLVVLALGACASAPAQNTISLAALKPLPAVNQASDVVPLRISVAAVISPRGTAESYQALQDYLADKLERPVELVQRRTYSETNELIRTGAVDLAFVCTSAYIVGHDDFGMELLVAPQVENDVVYHSLLLVRSDSTARTMRDLESMTFAFTDPISNTGRVYPTFLVQQLGSTPGQFFSRTFFTYSHDDAIRAVANGLADAAAVDSLVYQYATERDPSLRQRVKVIHQSPSFGIPPVVVNPNIRPQLRVTLQDVLLNMVNDVSGQEALRAIGVERFTLIEDSAYDSARMLVNAVGPFVP